MKATLIRCLIVSIAVPGFAAAVHGAGNASPPASPIGRVTISTLPVASGITVRSATYTPSGKVLLSYADDTNRSDRRYLKLAIMDDDGRNMRPIFAQHVPERAKDNGIRFMVFPDNKRVFLGDYIIECAPSFDACAKSTLAPVTFPPEVASGDHIFYRWSEIITAPDNRHIAWTTLFSNYSAMVFVGELQKTGAAYRIAAPRIISTLNNFAKDPAHPDGVRPVPVSGGEVKQFVHGGAALSVVGAIRRVTPDSVVLDLATGKREGITDTPGYTETTIFSPDERLGLTMSTRFSPHTDLGIVGLMPRPYPDSLDVGLNMLAYTYSVTGVRHAREGDIGPALIDIQASKTQDGYLGLNLSREKDWIFRSPMSWHPSSKKAMWIEIQHGGSAPRIRIASLPEYRPGAAVAARPTPRTIPGSVSDMSAVKAYARTGQTADVKVYGRKAGYILYRHTPTGVIEKSYVDFSDDGVESYSGSERMESNPAGRSTYIARVKLSGPKSGSMDLKMTFGPLEGKLPAQIIFDPDASGVPLTHGYAEYNGKRLTADSFLP